VLSNIIGLEKAPSITTVTRTGISFATIIGIANKSEVWRYMRDRR
jgi:hypothetical protein